MWTFTAINYPKETQNGYMLVAQPYPRKLVKHRHRYRHRHT